MDYKKESDLLAEAISKIEFLESEKENRAAELFIANLELDFQNREKERRAAELLLANKELAFQNREKIKRADELVLANVELAFQKKEKGNRAEELVVANKELASQSKEKIKRAEELVLANIELAFQKKEKGNRADELEKANMELVFQNREKEKRTAELTLANKLLAVQKIQLEDFCNILSHNLRGPLINISILVDDIADSREESEIGILRDQLRITTAILGEIFDELVESLQVKYDLEIQSKIIDLTEYLDATCDSLRGQINRSGAVIEFDFEQSPFILFPPKYVRSILHNLISNSLKYQSLQRNPLIKVKSKREGDKVLLAVSDNGLGIDLKKHNADLFQIRRVFHAHPEAKGFGLFFTKCQIEAMNGRIWAKSMPGVGSTFYVEFNNQKLSSPLNTSALE